MNLSCIGDNDSCDSLLGSDDPLDQEWLDASLRELAVAHAAEQGKQPQTQKPPGDNSEIPFTLVTWNIWFSRHDWQARLESAVWETLLHRPDVFCFQEVTTDVHNCMLGCQYLRERYEPTEKERLPHGYDVAIWVKKEDSGNRSLRWHGCRTIPLESIYGRRGLCLDLEISTHLDNGEGDDTFLSRVRILTVHLESGREMAITREKQLNDLFSYIRGTPWNEEEKSRNDHGQNENPNGRAIDASILVGDLNLAPDYPENLIVESNGIDVWKALRPNEDGFTEDTFKNKMRYHAHGKHKQVRYDRVILVPQCLSKTGLRANPLSIDLLGDAPFDQEHQLWASDHFGLVTRIGLCENLVDVETYQVKNEMPKKWIDGYTTP